ncbi:hypothetical protein [Acidithiobacillus sp.]|uniref:hypothetical protein n=1 Tax=Acidithiobacillus sp. TaxID=1872118 RepID=UPI0025BBE18A|nr:hypothetical protein [Acidithiobacillus sp.]
MSRFYALELYAPTAQQQASATVTLPIAAKQGILPKPSPTSGTKTYPGSPTKVWTSHPNGIYDPGAQNIQFDVLTFGQGIGQTIFTIQVEGVSFQDIQQHNNFRDYGLKLYAGMLPGLPLANQQPTPGLIVQGYVLEGIGNWVGNDMTLTFVVNPDPFTEDNPGNLVFQWKPGQTLAQALQNMLSVAYPGWKFTASISSNLVTNHVVTHRAATLSDFASWLEQYTRHRLGPKYRGVEMFFRQGHIVATDYTQTPTSTPPSIRFDELIGQPVWSDAAQMDLMVALRADVRVGDQIKLPYTEAAPGLQVELPQTSNASLDYQKSFNGTFIVSHTRQLGDFRGESGQDWITVIRCYATTVDGPGEAS